MTHRVQFEVRGRMYIRAYPGNSQRRKARRLITPLVIASGALASIELAP